VSRGKYLIVQRTGFMPYFLCAWQPSGKDSKDSKDSWDCLRSRALVFDGPMARQIVSQLNARNPAAVVPVTTEVMA